MSRNRPPALISHSVRVVDETRARLNSVWPVEYEANNELGILFEMMTYKRPYRSKSEEDFISKFLAPLIEEINVQENDKNVAWFDSIGNIFFCVEEKGPSETLFSCHTDTVHPSGGGRQTLVYDDEWVMAQEESQLGADDAVGVWIMCECIKARKPGLYIFHVGEEAGGVGSLHAAKESAHLLRNCKRAIAFDRRGTHSIITEQARGVCCSYEFAAALGRELKLGHVADDTGSFTDTANYLHLIPECTNISAGYEREHSYSEKLNYQYALKLLQAVLAADFESLPTARKAETPEWELHSFTEYSHTRGWSQRTLEEEHAELKELRDFVQKNPDAVAALLQEYCITIGDLEGYIQ